jgi:hypothetical protein
LEGNVSLRNPVTPPGINRRTIRLVAQHLNHYATPGSDMMMMMMMMIQVYLSDSFVEGKSVYFFKTLSVTNNGKLFVYVLTFFKNYYILSLLQ